MVEIVSVYRETLPALRLIGRRYTDDDRGEDGGFGDRWGEWFENGWFKPLENLGSLPENGNAYLGVMRCVGEFEYWIGMFFPAGTPVPDGYACADIPAGDIGVCWLYGREDAGELYGAEPHNLCMAKIQEAGWKLAEDPWFLERYNCHRFTTPDASGRVILDYCIYLKDA